MKYTDFSAQFPTLWAASASSNTVQYPLISTPAGGSGRASIAIGFPQENFQPPASGGVYPFGQDWNGALKTLSVSAQNYESGAIPVFSSVFASSIGGYPLNATVSDANGNLWTSTADANTSTPGASGASWVAGFSGRLLKSTSYASGSTPTWTPDPRTKFVIVELQGAGGAGGGCAVTGSDQQAVAWGGTAGTYVRSGLIPASVFGNSQTVTVGTGGAPQAGADGGNGGTSSFGSLLSAPGGAGGSLGRANAVTSAIGQDGALSPAATGSVDIAVQARGSGGSGPIALGTQQSTRGGSGGRAHFGPGGAGGLGTGVAPVAGVGGGGGGGQAVGSQSSQSTTGAYGGDGVVIVWEYL